MSHPLAVELENEESLESSQFMQRHKSRDDKCYHIWTPQGECQDWSDADEWLQQGNQQVKRFRPRQDLNSTLMTIEAFLVVLTLISPILIYIVPYLWTKHLSGDDNSTGNCRMLCEVRILSLCVKYVILSTVLITSYAVRLRATFCCTERMHASSSSRWRLTVTGSPDGKLSKSKTALSVSESDRQNFPIYFLLDFLTATVTFIFWISLIAKWHSQVTRLMRTGKQKLFATNNPFMQSNADEEEKNDVGNVALIDAGDFVDAQLFIQIAGALFIKAWQTSCGTQRFLVHVIRAPDSFSHAYRIGLVDVHSAAVHVIQNLSIEPRLHDPLTSNKRHRNATPKSTTRSTIFDHEYTPPEDQTHAESLVTTTRRRRRSRHKLRNEFRQFGMSERPKSEVVLPTQKDEDNADRTLVGMRESNSNLNTPYLGTINQRELNSAATARLNLQSEYDFLLLKRQTRLKLLVAHWFQTVQTIGEAEFEKGPTVVRLLRIRESANLIFEHIGTPLLKYLRFTGQQDKHQEWNIRQRLVLYLTCGMTADAFLAPYFKSHPQLIHNPQRETRSVNHMPDPSHHLTSCWPFNAPNEDTESPKDTGSNHICCSSSQNLEKQRSKNQVFQTWKLRIRHKTLSSGQTVRNSPSRNLSINSLIHHGLCFELVRADVTLLCTVYRLPMIQLISYSSSSSSMFSRGKWTNLISESKSMPASTIETCLGSSENFMEIRL